MPIQDGSQTLWHGLADEAQYPERWLTAPGAAAIEYARRLMQPNVDDEIQHSQRMMLEEALRQQVSKEPPERQPRTAWQGPNQLPPKMRPPSELTKKYEDSRWRQQNGFEAHPNFPQSTSRPDVKPPAPTPQARDTSSRNAPERSSRFVEDPSMPDVIGQLVRPESDYPYGSVRRNLNVPLTPQASLHSRIAPTPAFDVKTKKEFVKDYAQNPDSLPQREAGLSGKIKGIEGQFAANRNFAANPMTDEEKQFAQPTLRERLMRKASTPTGSKFTQTGEGVDATLQTPDARGPAGRGNLWAALSGSPQGRQMARPLSASSGEDSMASLSPEDRRAHLQGTGYKGDFTRRAPGMANDTFGKYAPPNAPGRGGQAGQLPGGSRILRGENGGIALEGPSAYGTDAEKEYLSRVSKQAGLSSPATSMEAFKQQQQGAAKASYDRMAQRKADSLQAMLMGRSGGQLADDADPKTKNAFSVGQRQQQALASRLAGGQQQQAAQEQQFLSGLVNRARSPEEAASIYQAGNAVLQARNKQQSESALNKASINHLNAQNSASVAHSATQLIQEARQYRQAAAQAGPNGAPVLLARAVELDAQAAAMMGGGSPSKPAQMAQRPARQTADELMANTPVARELAAAVAAEEERKKKREANRFGPLTPQRSSAPWGAG